MTCSKRFPLAGLKGQENDGVADWDKAPPYRYSLAKEWSLHVMPDIQP